MAVVRRFPGIGILNSFMKVLIAPLTFGIKMRLKAASKLQSLTEAAPPDTTPVLKLIYTNIYNTVTICFFMEKEIEMKSDVQIHLYGSLRNMGK